MDGRVIYCKLEFAVYVKNKFVKFGLNAVDRVLTLSNACKRGEGLKI